MPKLLSPFVPHMPTDAGYQRLTGTSSQAITTALSPGKFGSILNSSDTPIAVRFSGSSPTAITTDIEIGTNQRLDWHVDDDTKWVAAICSDGTTTFECWVWESST